ncbi:MAG TPA: ATP-binding protein [Marinagarivorans sp.]
MKSLSISLTATVVTATIFLGFLFNIAYTNWFDHQEFELEILKSNASSLANVIDHSENPSSIIATWNSASPISLAMVPSDSIRFPEALAKQFLTGDGVVLSSPKGVYAHYFLARSNAILEVKLDPLLPAPKQPLAQLIMTLCFYGALGFTVLLWLLPLIKQLQRLNVVALKLSEGNFLSRVTPSRFSYIRNIEQTFNHMAQKIQQLLEDNKLLTRAVSHNLKTPLSRFRFGIDILMDEPLNSSQRKNLSHLERDLDAMETLVSCLLDYAKLEEGSVAIQPTCIEAGNVINGVIAQFNHSNNLTLEATLDENLIINTDERLLTLILQNLIENAMQFAASRVTIAAFHSPKGIKVTIEDDGPGILCDDIERLIKPFQKGEQALSNSINNKNHGMGLAICKKLAQWLKIQWAIDRSPDLSGARITLNIPYR